MASVAAGTAMIALAAGGAHAQQAAPSTWPPASVTSEQASPASAAGGGQAAPAPALRRVDQIEPDPWTVEVEPRLGRLVPVDGDLSGPQADPVPQDGVITDAEAPAPIDGVDPTQVDTRSPEEAEPFELPRAADDAQAFAIPIEPEPARDRRPERLFRFEPYEPVGIRAGRFVVYPEIEIGGAATNNVFRSGANRKGDAALETRPALRVISDWGRHGVEVNLRGLSSFHAEHPSEDDRGGAAEVRGRLDLSRDTRIETSFGRELAQETRGSVNALVTPTGRAEVTTDRAAVALTHRFNRLSLQLRGAAAEQTYEAPSENGVILATEERDYTQREAALRATWSFRPDFGIFAEAGFDDRTYKAPSQSDGLLRDSTGERLRAGVSFGNASRILRGEASIGHATQRFEDGRLPALRGIIVDANLAWRISGLTSLLVTARSDIGESTVAGSGGAIARSAGVELRHAFRRHLIGTAGLRFSRADYEGVDVVEEDLTASLALEYHLNRQVTLFGRYAHIDFASSVPGGGYDADEIRVGVRLRR
jgi:hypothetical protein